MSLLLKKQKIYQKKSQFDNYENMINEVSSLCNEYYELIPRTEFAQDKL